MFSLTFMMESLCMYTIKGSLIVLFFYSLCSLRINLTKISVSRIIPTRLILLD